MTNRELAALETRRRLIETAKEIIAEKGLANTSVAEITRRCGVSKGTFYTYFKKKEDIVYELNKNPHENLFDQAMAREGDVLDRLRYYLTEEAGIIEAGSLRLCQEWVRNSVNPDLIDYPEYQDILQSDYDFLCRILVAGVQAGELKADTPIEQTSQVLEALLYGQMLCWDMTNGAHSFRERTEEFCNLFLESMVKNYLTA